MASPTHPARQIAHATPWRVSLAVTLVIAITSPAIASPGAAGEAAPQPVASAGFLDAEGALETSDAVQPITVLPLAGADVGRPIPVGAFCPTRPSDPMREASTFGASALLMWALARRRVRAAES